MAYISTEEVKEIRNNIKKLFPSKEGWKLSVTRRHHSEVSVIFLEAPINLDPKGLGHYQINDMWIEEHYSEEPTLKEAFTKAKNAITNVKVNEDRNFGDMGADYANYNYFIDLAVGKWNKPFQVKG